MKLVTIVEDHIPVAEKMKSWILEATITQFPQIDLIHEYSQVENYFSQQQTDLAILDIGIGRGNIFHLVEKIKNNVPKIVIYTAFESPAFIFKAFDLKLHAYISKGASSKEFIQLISAPSERNMLMCSETKIIFDKFSNMKEVWKPLDHLVLTPKEEEIVRCYLDNLPNQSICKILKISEQTLLTHRRNMQVKNGANLDKILLTYRFKTNLQKF
jgi:DNA-binding NarL/FixJ family response regulator